MTETTTTTDSKVRKEKIMELFMEEFPGDKLPNFAKFAKNQLGNKIPNISTMEPHAVVHCLSDFFSQKVIPVGLSLNRLLTEFKSWGDSEDTFRRFSSIDETPKKKDVVSINTTATETGGMVLKDIGNALDPGRSLSATAINQLIDKLIPNELNKEAKLSQYKQMLKASAINKEHPQAKAFAKTIKKACVKAAGQFVNFIEMSRGDDELVTVAGIVKVLEENKLYDSLDQDDRKRESMLLELFANWANDIELADDDVWQELVMEALVEDYQTGAISERQKEVMTLDLPREELNIMKSFQQLVAVSICPPPRRGRPPKNKTEK